LYRNDGIHLNELGTEKLAKNLDIVKKVHSSDNNFTQKTVRESVSNVKIDRSKQGNNLYNDKQSNGKFKNHSRGNVSHNDRSNDFSVDSSAHVYSNRWGNSNNNKDSYRSHNLNRHEKQTNCWFCNETGHTAATITTSKTLNIFTMFTSSCCMPCFITEPTISLFLMFSVLDVVIMVTKPNIVHLSNVLAMKGVPNQ
jgi:hypothetical protein